MVLERAIKPIILQFLLRTAKVLQWPEKMQSATSWLSKPHGRMHTSSELQCAEK